MIENFKNIIDLEKCGFDLPIEESFNVERAVNEIEFIELPANLEVIERAALFEKHFSSDDSYKLARFFDDLISAKVSEIFIDSIASFGEIRINHPLCDHFMVCRHSIQLDFRNFLRFELNKEIIYIYQNNFVCDAVYFPYRNICISIKHSFDIFNEICNLYNKILEYGSFYNAYFSQKPEFGGVKLDHPSPYHWYYLKFYDFLSLTSHLKEKKFSVNVVTTVRGTFLQLNKLLPHIVNVNIHLSDFVYSNNKKVPVEFFNNNFYLGLGCRWEDVNKKNESFVKEKLKSLDDTVVEAIEANSNDFPIFKKVYYAHKENHFILWLGITSGKRAWIEEVDAYAALIEKISLLHKNVTVVFDGWTATYKVGGELSSANKMYDNDELIKDKIIKNVDYASNINYVSVIGRAADEKIAIARKIDFFVANHATGSLWVSRIARNAGVVHISNAARKSSLRQHVHWDSLLIDSNKVCDIEAEKSPTPYHVSYSITVESFLEVCFYKLYEKSLRIPNEKNSYFDEIANRLHPEHKSPDFYREIALAFEEFGDINTANVLMYKAYLLRPNGPFIKKKFLEYQAKLKEINNEDSA